MTTLPGAVCSLNRRRYLVRVPVAVEDDDGIGGLQVEAEAAGARRQNEDEVLGVGRVELHQQLAAIVRLRRAVQPQVLVVCCAQTRTQDVNRFTFTTARQQDDCGKATQLP